MKNAEQLSALDKNFYMNTFGERIPIVFTHGESCKLYDSNGMQYTDFLAGIATNSLGYAHKGLTSAICTQAQKLIHLSNYFYNEPQAELAKLLCENSCADKVFFASTGAEANEGAFKLARKYWYKKGQARFEIISAKNSFHGRTLAAIAATGQEKYQKPYAPLPSGFLNIQYGSIDAIKEAISCHTAAIIIECIQGEGGIIEGGEKYIKELRALCDETGIILIIDEVQTGMGRTGKLFCHEHYGIEPDIFTAAKALGNGLPISAIMCKDKFAAFEPGDHGTTLGGNALCCAAGLFIAETMTSAGFLEDVAKKGEYFKENLIELSKQHPIMEQIRGIGLMLGIKLGKKLSAAECAKMLREKGFLVGTAGDNTLRLVPPLIISYDEIDSLLECMKDIF